MKKLILSTFILLFTFTSYAQYFGIQAGALASNVKWRNEHYTLNTLLKPGFILGVTMDIPIQQTMAVNLALNYKWAGAGMIDTTNVEELQLGYINLDVTFNYIFQTTSEVRPYIEGGGFGAYLVNSKLAIMDNQGDLIREDIKVGTSEDDDIVPYDIGLTIGGGIYYRSWRFGFGYSESIIDLSPNKDLILRNKIGYLKATYFFGKKKSK